MIGIKFLDLVIGLIFIYLIYSIACSTIWELFVNLSHLRGKMLRHWIRQNFSELEFEDKGGIEKRRRNRILEHPIIKGLYSRKSGYLKLIPHESYTPAEKNM